MVIARLTVIVIAIIGVIWARNRRARYSPSSPLPGPVSALPLARVVLLALFWKRSNKYGALAGMIAGGVMVFVWKYCIAPIGGILNIYELLPAFVIAIIVNVVVSLATKAPEAEVVKEYDEVAAMKD